MSSCELLIIKRSVIIIRTWLWGEGGSFLLSSEDKSFMGPLSGLMKLLMSNGREWVVVVVAAAVVSVVLGSLGARGRNLLQPSVREGSCSQNPRVNWCTFMLPIYGRELGDGEIRLISDYIEEVGEKKNSKVVKVGNEVVPATNKTKWWHAVDLGIFSYKLNQKATQLIQPKVKIKKKNAQSLICTG